MQFSGHPGQIPEEADAVVITTDAVVIASSVGTGILVRLGRFPGLCRIVSAREPQNWVVDRLHVSFGWAFVTILSVARGNLDAGK